MTMVWSKILTAMASDFSMFFHRIVKHSAIEDHSDKKPAFLVQKKIIKLPESSCFFYHIHRMFFCESWKNVLEQLQRTTLTSCYYLYYSHLRLPKSFLRQLIQ